MISGRDPESEELGGNQDQDRTGTKTETAHGPPQGPAAPRPQGGGGEQGKTQGTPEEIPSPERSPKDAQEVPRRKTKHTNRT
jgi:hypothetical protein